MTISVTVGTVLLPAQNAWNFEEHSGTERWTGYVGTVKLSGLVIKCTEKGQANKVNEKQIVKDFTMHKAQSITFRQVSNFTTTTGEGALTTGTLSTRCMVCKNRAALFAFIYVFVAVAAVELLFIHLLVSTLVIFYSAVKVSVISFLMPKTACCTDRSVQCSFLNYCWSLVFSTLGLFSV